MMTEADFARRHIRNIQWALGFDARSYRDYAWDVRDALQGWTNDRRLEAWQIRRRVVG